MAENSSSCIACEGNLVLFGRRLDYEYHRCSSCGTIQLLPMPDEADTALSYESEYANVSHYESDPDRCRASAGPYYRAIIRVLRDYGVKGKVLDYGTGWGGLLGMLTDNGFECQGVEMSSEMAGYCRELGLPVKQGDIKEVKGERYSAIVLCTVFEHLTDHGRWLSGARQLLENNGLLITLQPTAGFAGLMGRILGLGSLHRPLPQLQQVFCPPWHTAFFSFEGMKILGRRNGFDLLEIRPAPQGRSGGITGIAQRCLEHVNRFGWYLMDVLWPLLIAHTFVLKKVDFPRETSALKPK
ncbi:MAG TPA: methyltransferase domain-containing protein [Desulfobacteraceae bacterium]|nr:methyltransferase domain-containing protein [Desulfobacteraceae bacterium]HPJ67750.1 methyltransferase domain-containing protein [Desulfobacteraceae bacterium]HPQ28100.1 methyltransferase domain-containing protein [Desulfobacteraceae bacterium]